MGARRTLRPELERALVERLLVALRAAGWRTQHISDSRMIVNQGGRPVLVADPECAGVPDIVACHPGTGRVVAIECKRRGQRPRPNQVEWLETWAACGATTFVATPENEAEVLAAVMESVPAAA